MFVYDELGTINIKGPRDCIILCDRYKGPWCDLLGFIYHERLSYVRKIWPIDASAIFTLQTK